MTTDAVHGISFPVEIWRMVITLAVKTSEPMDNYHDASKPLATRFHLARRVTSKSPEYALMLVCKSFNHIATEFFYEKVSIHSRRQLETLAKRLKVRKVANNLAKWTRRLDVKYTSRETDHNDCDVGSINQLAPILRWCPNLTHLIIDVVDFPSEYGDKDVEVIVDTCVKSCKRLEVLHWDFDLITHEPVTVPIGTFSTAFRNIKVLRVGNNFKLDTSFDEPTFDRFPFLHTIEVSQRNLFDHFNIVRLPSLSTFHVRNENVPDLVEGMMGFFHVYGKTIKTLTIIGAVGKRDAKCTAIFLRRCTRLEELVMDVIDLTRLLALGRVLHREVTRLSLTNDAPTALPSGSNLLAALIPNLKVHFPKLGVLRWLGDVGRSVSCSHNQEGLDSSEDDAGASEVHTSEIRIENRDGEKLELDWLLVR